MAEARLVGVLTGGGDAPGLNAALCGLGIRLAAEGVKVLGFRDGWRGVIEDDALLLEPCALLELVPRGGTILGSSSASPYREPERDVPRVLATFRRHRLEALVAIGGDGTLGAAARLAREHGLPIIGVPKTIDNDLAATDFTFGFFTAVERATNAIDQLRTTADSHGRVLVVECMGRHAGWIAAYAGVASACEAILVPERPVELRRVLERLAALRAAGRRSAMIAAAEGARPTLDGRPLAGEARDEFGEYRIGGVAQHVASAIQQELGWEARAMVLGHLQRAGSPIAFDRIFALRLGAKAARLVAERRFGRMAALANGEVVDVELEAAIAERKVLSARFLDRYEDFFVPLSAP